MSQPSDKWFYRGREARGQGLPRLITDSRLSAGSRAQWLAGWDEENRFRQPAPTDQQLAEARGVVSRLKDFARTL